jgi:murein DD-endopeptidase MepM/ murein hydrolase activator NlpD
MSDEKKERLPLLERLRHTYYRMVILNHDTFEEIGSYKLSLLSFYVLLSSVFVALALLVTAAIVFTPLKQYIPGYGEGNGDSRVINLNQTVTKLERELKAQQTYTESFRRMLQGDVRTQKDVPNEEIVMNDSLTQVKRSEEDKLLRDQVANGGFYDEEDIPANLAKSVGYSPRNMNIEQLYFVPPLSGTVSMQYSPDKKHYGIDVIAPKNSAIKAAMDGFIVMSDWTLETGNTIGIQHANNIVTFYKHNSVLLKKTGEKVKAGEAIAIIGNTGELTNGPHLHFEIWNRGTPVNPEDYISF